MIARNIAILSFLFGLCSPCRCENLLIEKAYPSLNMQGNTYPSACVFDERRSLKESLRSLKYPDEKKAWKIVEMVLCGPSNRITRSYLEHHISKNLRNEEVTGKWRSQIFSLTKAWNAALRADLNDRKSLGISLQYFSNEACVKELTLEYDKNKWMIYKISEVCD